MCIVASLKTKTCFMCSFVKYLWLFMPALNSTWHLSFLSGEARNPNSAETKSDIINDTPSPLGHGTAFSSSWTHPTSHQSFTKKVDSSWKCAIMYWNWNGQGPSSMSWGHLFSGMRISSLPSWDQVFILASTLDHAGRKTVCLYPIACDHQHTGLGLFCQWYSILIDVWSPQRWFSLALTKTSPLVSPCIQWVYW